MKLKNELFKLLRKEGEKLPQEFYEVRHKYPQYIVQENIDIAMKMRGGIVIEDDYSYPEEHKVNHSLVM
jgi:predicted membrane-bound dolichyl-phosphate-mannose-protein mannosyltransferase